jgi:hypothetical protein
VPDERDGGAAVSVSSYENSVQDNSPRELVEISINDGITYYRHTSASQDQVYGGNTYSAIPMERSEQMIAMPGEERDVVLSLPIDHALCRRYPVSNQPPMKITVTIRRLYPDDSITTIWAGEVEAMSSDGGIGKFKIPSRASAYMLRSVPSSQVSRACPHMIYDSMCRASRAASAPTSGILHTQTVTVTAIDGRDITVNLSGVTATDAFRATWAEYGEVYHAATGERMTVLQQKDTDPGVGTVAKLTLSGVIVGLAVGMTVVVYAGCDWRLDTTCEGKFNNRQNFGGVPLLPSNNPFVATGCGLRGGT